MDLVEYIGIYWDIYQLDMIFEFEWGVLPTWPLQWEHDDQR